MGNPWLVLVAMTGSLSMIMLDQTVVAVALPSIANFAALTGDADTAIPLYAASQVDSRRSGTYWPIQLQSDTLLDRMRERRRQGISLSYGPTGTGSPSMTLRAAEG
jgi:hypothetical protein